MESFSLSRLWSPEQPLPAGSLLMRLAEVFCRAWGVSHLAAAFKVSYNPRLRTTLGRAFLEEGRVELNTRLLREHPDQLLPTLAHELAHLVAYRKAGREAPPHGRVFRALMRQVNFSEKATHNLPTGKLKRSRQKYLYMHRCRDCGATFIARKVRRNVYCVACGPEMRWEIFRAPNTPQERNQFLKAE